MRMIRQAREQRIWEMTCFRDVTKHIVGLILSERIDRALEIGKNAMVKKRMPKETECREIARERRAAKMNQAKKSTNESGQRAAAIQADHKSSRMQESGPGARRLRDGRGAPYVGYFWDDECECLVPSGANGFFDHTSARYLRMCIHTHWGNSRLHANRETNRWTGKDGEGW